MILSQTGVIYLIIYDNLQASLLLVISLILVKSVTEEFSSSGDSKTEDDPEKRLPKDKDGKDRDRDREEGGEF